jgi:hypothetical protein
MKAHLTVAAALLLAGASGMAAQQKSLVPDLSGLAGGQGLQVINRTASTITDGARKGLRLSKSAGGAPIEGVAYIQGVEFGNGTIEIDLRGEDLQGQSFVGVAFHGVDKSTYDAVYFRPFNFRATDSTRRAHAVQYISHPTYTWQKLRTERSGVFEKPVDPVPDPNGWFRARIVVSGPTVSVFVGDAAQPSLVVSRLSDRTGGMIGLWVGGNGGGDFANLTIRPN